LESEKEVVYDYFARQTSSKTDEVCLKSPRLTSKPRKPRSLFRKVQMLSSIPQEMAITRYKILRAAQAVLASKKVSGTRMRQISQSAGISMGTLHYYFSSKTSLLLTVLDEMQKFFEGRQQHLLAHDLDASEKIRLFSSQQQLLLQEHPEVEEVFLDFWGHAMVNSDIHDKIQSMYNAWRRDIRLAIQQGVLSGEFDPEQVEIAPYLMVAMLEGVALQYLSDKSQVKLDQTFQAVYQIMIHWLQGDITASPENEPDHRKRKPYPTDLDEAQWLRIAPMLSPAKAGGRPRTIDLREVANALLYSAACACPWRMLPHDFPGWQTVYAYYRQWQADGTLEKIAATLHVDFTQKGQGL
jgi:transposase/AcrR family transcriptional regulator